MKNKYVIFACAIFGTIIIFIFGAFFVNFVTPKILQHSTENVDQVIDKVINTETIKDDIKNNLTPITIIYSDSNNYLRCGDGFGYLIGGVTQSYYLDGNEIPKSSVLFSYNEDWLYMPGFTYRRSKRGEYEDDE